MAGHSRCVLRKGQWSLADRGVLHNADQHPAEILGALRHSTLLRLGPSDCCHSARAVANTELGRASVRAAPLCCSCCAAASRVLALPGTGAAAAGDLLYHRTQRRRQEWLEPNAATSAFGCAQLCSRPAQFS